MEGEHRPVQPLTRRRRCFGKHEPDRGRENDERDQERPGRALAVSEQEKEVGDAQHPAEE
jgi:hypothetical protein